MLDGVAEIHLHQPRQTVGPDLGRRARGEPYDVADEVGRCLDAGALRSKSHSSWRNSPPTRTGTAVPRCPPAEHRVVSHQYQSDILFDQLFEQAHHLLAHPFELLRQAQRRIRRAQRLERLLHARQLLAQFLDIVLNLDRHLVALVQDYGAWVYAILFLIVFAETGLVDGITTNPSLVAKTGRPFVEVVKEICSIVSGSVTPLPLASWPTNNANGG